MTQRIHGDSVSFRYKKNQLKNTLKIQKKYYLSIKKNKFDNRKFFILNKYFLGDKKTFLDNKINIASACLEVLELYKDIQFFTNNKSIEKFFLKKFIIHFFSSIGKINSLDFFLKIFMNFKLAKIFNIIIFLCLNKLKNVWDIRIN